MFLVIHNEKHILKRVFYWNTAQCEIYIYVFKSVPSNIYPNLWKKFIIDLWTAGSQHEKCHINMYRMELQAPIMMKIEPQVYQWNIITKTNKA